MPYFDLTVSAVKSVSVLHASYRVAARQARDRGDDDRAAAFDARADELEDALLDSAREAVGWLDRHAAYTRTGHHSARSGEWRDGGGLVASLFLHHLSRDGDPQLHVHVAIWNRIQRGDGADDRWRTLDSRTLHGQRLGVAPVADRTLETRLTALGYVMVPRADGNGAEIGGVPQDVMDLFSSRAVAVTSETGPSRPASTRRCTASRRPGGRCGCCTSRPGSAPAAPRPRPAAPWPGRPARPSRPRRSGSPPGKPRPCTANCARCRPCTSRSPAFAAERAGRAPAVLDDAAKRTAARIAVAEVQKQHAVWSMAQLRFEVHRALPVLPAGTDGEAVVDEVARLAVCGRAGTEVVQVTAPDIADVTSLGVRASDGGSIYRPPNAERYCTLAHLDTEEQILAAAKRTVPQLVSAGQARAAAEHTGLTAEQRDAVVMMLTATTAATVLVAPAGAGKSHTMAEFARLWTTFTGRRVIGLTTSTNAARVLAHEGLAESYNIAEFLGKTEGSDELRRPVPLHRDDVLVLDEASQLSTADLAMIGEAARQAGARIIATGDTAQLGAVEAGGMLALLASEVPAAQLHEVRRFAAEWEREASVRLRDGDLAAVAAYDRHGRIRAADEETAYDRAASMWLADHLRGKDVLLLAGSNAEAADLSRRVQARLVQLGTVGPPQAAAVGRQPRRDRRPGPRPPQHRDRRRRPHAHQPRHPAGHRLARTGRRGPAAAPGRDLDRAVPRPPVLPRATRRARLRRERPRRPGPHRRHRPPPSHRHLVPAGPVRRHDPRPGIEHRARGHRQDRPAREQAVPAGRPGIRARRRPAARRGRPVRYRADPPGPGMGRGNRSPAPPVVRRCQADPLPGHRRADHGQAHRLRSLAVPAGTLPAGAAAHAAGCPAGRA